MLKPEARWLSQQIRSLDVARASPMLNVGSSTRQLREVDQPWIHGELFAPWLARGGEVIHQDLKPDDGVDVVGSLTDPACQARLMARGVRSVCCTSVLEHVPDPEDFARHLSGFVPPGGSLLVTVPRAFPWHPDAIDTMFRPSVAELAALFPDLRLVAGEVVPCGTLWHLVAANPVHALRRLVRPQQAPTAPVAPGTPRARREALKARLRWVWPWAVRPFEMTCAVFTRP